MEQAVDEEGAAVFRLIDGVAAGLVFLNAGVGEGELALAAAIERHVVALAVHTYGGATFGKEESGGTFVDIA